jgi:hypothetical protein
MVKYFFSNWINFSYPMEVEITCFTFYMFPGQMHLAKPYSLLFREFLFAVNFQGWFLVHRPCLFPLTIRILVKKSESSTKHFDYFFILLIIASELWTSTIKNRKKNPHGMIIITDSIISGYKQVIQCSLIDVVRCDLLSKLSLKK